MRVAASFVQTVVWFSSVSETFDFETFDRRAGRYVKTPELTIQASGSISVNSAAYKLLGEPQAVEFLYDTKRNVMGVRKVDPSTAHAYPMRGVGKAGTRQTYVSAPRAFFAYYDIPLGSPVRREVKMSGDVLIVDLNDPGRVVISNRNRAKLMEKAQQNENSARQTPRRAQQDPQQRPLLG